MRLSSVPQLKVAMSKADVNRAVAEHLSRAELRDIPAINMGDLFESVITNLSRKFRWDQDYEESVMSAVVQNMILGMNLDTGNSYQDGTLADKIRQFRAQGKDDGDIKTLLGRQVAQMAMTKLKYDRRREQSGMEDMGGSEGEGEMKMNMFDRVLSLNPLSRAEAAQWMSMTSRDTVLRDLLKQIDRIISTKASDEGQKLLWKTLRENPDFTSISGLEREMVTFLDTGLGVPRTMPLADAMTVLRERGVTKTDNVRYMLEKKIMPLLARIKPIVLDALRETERG